jgi:hypothetical protein
VSAEQAPACSTASAFAAPPAAEQHPPLTGHLAAQRAAPLPGRWAQQTRGWSWQGPTAEERRHWRRKFAVCGGGSGGGGSGSAVPCGACPATRSLVSPHVTAANHKPAGPGTAQKTGQAAHVRRAVNHEHLERHGGCVVEVGPSEELPALAERHGKAGASRSPR